MADNKTKILITFREDGQNGGPFISHKRILESKLREKYDLVALYIPNARKLRNPKVFLNTVKRLKAEKADMVLLCGLQTEGFMMTLACQCARLKRIMVVHGSSTEAIGFSKTAQFIFKLIEEYTVKHATATFGVSDYVSSWTVCKKAKHYYGTIYNIADFSQKLSPMPNIRKSLGIAEDDIVITSTGRITTDKGFDILADVAKHFKDNDKVKFIVAGDGEYRSKWIADIEKENMQKQVFLLGYRSDIDDILRESDIFVICTKHETLCNSLLEGGIYNLPLVATNVGGIPEIIDDGENGFLVPLNDVDGFVNALNRLVNDADLRKKMGTAAKEKVEGKFGEKGITERLSDVFTYVLGANK